MLTVPEAARRSGKNPETIRRWIRSGRLKAEKVGTQHVIDERDLAAATVSETSLPKKWTKTPTGEIMPDWVAIVREGRGSR